MNLSPAGLFVSLFFSLVGFAAYRHGKRNAEVRPLVLGVILMVYGYFIPSAWISLAVGLVLTGLLFYPQ